MPDRRYAWDEGSDLQFRVYGIPASQGSKTRMPNGAMVEGASTKAREELKAWRNAVTDAAVEFIGDGQWLLIDEPVCFQALFLFPRPKSHTKARLANPYHYSKPDMSKLVRSTEDALTGILWRDDCLIAVYGRTIKKYCPPGILPGAVIRIYNLRNWA